MYLVKMEATKVTISTQKFYMEEPWTFNNEEEKIPSFQE